MPIYIYTHKHTRPYTIIRMCIYIYCSFIFPFFSEQTFVNMCLCTVRVSVRVSTTLCVCEREKQRVPDVLFYSICVPPALCGIVRHQFEIKTCDVGKAYRTWREYKIFDQNTFELCPRRRKNSDEQKTGSRVNPLLLRASGSRIF